MSDDELQINGIHELADIFPEMEEDTFALLKADIKENGLQEPLVLTTDGMIIDGRHRYRACVELGIMPTAVVYADDSPLTFVVSRNLHRRHLNESQRAMVGARLMVAGAVTRDAASTLMNVSGDSINKARHVIKFGTTELQTSVDQGAIKVAVASAITKLPLATQAKHLKKHFDSLRERKPQAPRNVELSEAEMAAMGQLGVDLRAIRAELDACMSRTKEVIAQVENSPPLSSWLPATKFSGLLIKYRQAKEILNSLIGKAEIGARGEHMHINWRRHR